MIFSSFFPYYSSKPLHEPSGGNHGLDLRCRSLSSPSAADLHHHPAPYLSLLCAKRSICARGSSNRYRSSVGMFLDFFYGSKMRKAKKKKKDLIVAAKNRERKVCFLIFLYFIFFYGFEMRKAGRKKKKRKERKNELRMCLAKRAVAKGGLVWLCSNCGTHVVGLITEMPLKTELWKLKTHFRCFQFP